MLQVTLAVMVCGWAHVLHGVFQPWGAGSITYFVQHLSLFVTTFVFLMGLLFKVRRQPLVWVWSQALCLAPRIPTPRACGWVCVSCLSTR
jgi:hypothetical protein